MNKTSLVVLILLSNTILAKAFVVSWHLRRITTSWIELNGAKPSKDTLRTTRRNTASAVSSSGPKRRRNPKWETMMSQLEQYYGKMGHSMVTERDNPELANWCKSIRKNYRHQVQAGQRKEGRPTLSEERLRRLHAINFVWDVQGYLWDERFSELCKYQAQHGHCQVPMTNSSSLGMWVHNQKCTYRALLQGKPSSLTPERLQALESIGFWDTFQSNEDLWNLRLQELKDFLQTFGHTNVPEDHEENPKLGQWVMNQRLFYKRYRTGQPSSLTPERIAALEKLDFRWNLHSYNWFQMCARLREFAKENGHLRIPTSDDENTDMRLWLIQQRYAFHCRQENRPSSMTDERQATLESIPEFEWKASSASGQGPSVEDWKKLFEGIRQKGIAPGMRPKQHWFEGTSRFVENIKDTYTDQDLWELWNQEEGDDS
jgi:hypothetical protein